MPPRRIRQPPPHELSWLYVPRRQASLYQLQGIINKWDQRRLEIHIRAHDIPYCRASHQVYVLGPHSRQYIRTSLRLLLTLDYVPRKVKIPVYHLPHNCRLCPENTRYMFRNHHPFEYVITIPHSRGQPCQDTIPPVSSTEELDSESDSDNSDSSTDDDSSDTRTSTRNKSPPPPPESPSTAATAAAA